MEASLAERQAEMKARVSGKTDTAKTRRRENAEVWCEQHYTVRQLADLWAMSPETVRRLIEDEPDVMRIGEGETRNKGRYFTYYIPESVARRVHAQACSNR